MPMVALDTVFQQNSGKNWQTLQTTTFQFVNLASLIRFDVTPCDCEGNKSLKSITVTSNKGIAGNGEGYYDSNMKLQPKEFTGNGKTITLNCVSADTIQGILSYVMVVPPVKEAELTFEITVETDENGTKNQETHTLGTTTLSFNESKYKTVAINLKKY